ncbi:helix-turn-helix transcriptional regulator [Nitrospirillum viridazoti]|uniref:DNA-binding CsgD family transcriptional regulator n=1 Tax=Nitrospirillum amazonense TaxID=28077 RepID=A0A560J689_9PROT|nr:helix-turn-helix transcriptional regulator [Nitrospirillum amazonense]TWB64090.1 DNA-binding CsgD family transcriptional regulator [Nitrospirillum amazonense]
MHELLLDLYACPSAPERWPAVLDQLCDRMSVLSAVVQVLDHQDGRFHPVWTVRDSYSSAHWREHDRVFNNDSNPRLRVGVGDPMPRHAAVTRDEDIFPPGSADLREVQRRRRALNLGANLSGIIQLSPGRFLALVLHRSADCPRPMGAEEEALAVTLLPHLRQTVALGEQLHMATLKADLLADATERLGAGIVLCDGGGRLIWANGSARAILMGSPVIRQSAGHVRAVLPADAIPFRRLLARAAGEAVERPLLLTLGRMEGDAVVQVMAMATRWAPAPVQVPGQPRPVLLLLREPGRPLNLSPASIAGLFGMSPAEARLTAGLCDGLSVAEYAHRRGIAEGTARIQLKRALAKAGCPRQAELVRRVCASLAVSLTQGGGLADAPRLAAAVP